MKNLEEINDTLGELKITFDLSCNFPKNLFIKGLQDALQGGFLDSIELFYKNSERKEIFLVKIIDNKNCEFITIEEDELKKVLCENHYKIFRRITLANKKVTNTVLLVFLEKLLECKECKIKSGLLRVTLNKSYMSDYIKNKIEEIYYEEGEQKSSNIKTRINICIWYSKKSLCDYISRISANINMLLRSIDEGFLKLNTVNIFYLLKRENYHCMGRYIWITDRIEKKEIIELRNSITKGDYLNLITDVLRSRGKPSVNILSFLDKSEDKINRNIISILWPYFVLASLFIISTQVMVTENKMEFILSYVAKKCIKGIDYLNKRLILCNSQEVEVPSNLVNLSDLFIREVMKVIEIDIEKEVKINMTRFYLSLINQAFSRIFIIRGFTRETINVTISEVYNMLSKMLEEKYARRVQAFLTGLERSTDLIFKYTENIQDMMKGMWEFGVAAFAYVLVNTIAFLIRTQTGGSIINLSHIALLLGLVLVIFAIVCWIRLREIRNSAKDGISAYSEFIETYGRQLGVEELLTAHEELNLNVFKEKIDKKYYFCTVSLVILTLVFLFVIGYMLSLIN